MVYGDESMIKKSISILFVIVIVLSVSACNKTETDIKPTDSTSKFENLDSSQQGEKIETETDEIPADIVGVEDFEKDTQSQTTVKQPTHKHEFAVANCTTPKKCSCGATEGLALGHIYQNAICVVCGVVDKEAILDEIEEKSSNLSYYNNMLENQKSLLNTLETSLKMYQENLADAKTKLDKAKTQKTIRVYYEDIGWVWEADPAKVKSAQDEVDHYTYMVDSQQSLVDSCNEKINKYTTQIEKIEKEIKELKTKL